MEVEEKIEEKEKNEEIAQPVPPFRNSARRTKRSAHVRLMLQKLAQEQKLLQLLHESQDTEPEEELLAQEQEQERRSRVKFQDHVDKRVFFQNHPSNFLIRTLSSSLSSLPYLHATPSFSVHNHTLNNQYSPFGNLPACFIPCIVPYLSVSEMHNFGWTNRYFHSSISGYMQHICASQSNGIATGIDNKSILKRKRENDVALIIQLPEDTWTPSKKFVSRGMMQHQAAESIIRSSPRQSDITHTPPLLVTPASEYSLAVTNVQYGMKCITRMPIIRSNSDTRIITQHMFPVANLSILPSLLDSTLLQHSISTKQQSTLTRSASLPIITHKLNVLTPLSAISAMP